MTFKKVTLETCGAATGTVVVIDVLRAFTTAAFALAAGARDVVLVGTVQEAFALREEMPGARVMGEVGGDPVEGFDFGNSPAALADCERGELTGRRMIQRTSAGTQGVVRSLRAEQLLASSFVCAGATARYIQQWPSDDVTFVITGRRPGNDGDEDAACADYITALLRGEKPDPTPYIERVYQSKSGRSFVNPTRRGRLEADLYYSVQIDRFDFAMPVERSDGLSVMQAIQL